jgi:hypothetical protein
MPVNRRIGRLLLAATLLLAGCATHTAPDGASSGPPGTTRLTASLTGPDSVRLSWTGGAADAAGRVVEYANTPDGQFTVLAFVPPQQTTYIHPDLMPATTFYYRVRPYFGPACAAVQIQLPPGPVDDNAPEQDQPWAVPQKVAQPPVTARSVRGTDPAAAAPTGLAATLMPAGGVRFTWTDRAGDEDGYLLEIRTPDAADYSVAEVLDPDVNSVGLLTLANQRTAAVRVRAFWYGASSNVAQQHTS